MNPLNKLIVAFVKILPKSVTYIFAKKYIAGKSLSAGVKIVKELNSKGIVATMDVLGEAIQSRQEAIAAKDECMETLDAIYNEKLDANLSVKPTQLGLMIDFDFGLCLHEEVLTCAKKYNIFVRLDMEDSTTTDEIIELYKKLRKKYDNVGVALQAYLFRTMNDVIDLNKINANYRLCKGIYVESEKIAYKNRKQVRDNFIDILKRILEDGAYVGIATHDDYIVNASLSLLVEMRIPKNKYEFQMLYGVKENLRDKLNQAGHKVRIYAPYGEHWHKYSIRRLQENPQVAWYIVKSIFTSK